MPLNDKVTIHPWSHSLQLPACVTILGGPKNGKSTVIYHLIENLKTKFSQILVMTPTPSSWSLFGQLVDAKNIYTGFEPEVLEVLMEECEKSVAAEGVKPNVLLVCDDLFHDNVVEVHPIWKTIHDRSFDLGISMISSRNHAGRAPFWSKMYASNFIGVMGESKRTLLRLAYDNYFEARLGIFEDFVSVLQIATLNARGSCLFYNAQSNPANCFSYMRALPVLPSSEVAVVLIDQNASDSVVRGDVATSSGHLGVPGDSLVDPTKSEFFSTDFLALRAAFVASSKAQRTLAKTIAARVQFEYTTNPRSAGVSIWKKHHPGILMDIQEAGDFLVHELARLDVSARVIPKFDPRGTGLIELVFTLDQ